MCYDTDPGTMLVQWREVDDRIGEKIVVMIAKHFFRRTLGLLQANVVVDGGKVGDSPITCLGSPSRGASLADTKRCNIEGDDAGGGEGDIIDHNRERGGCCW